MEENKFSIVEWKIENFTCWRERLHGACIHSPDLLSTSVFRELVHIFLFPRGPRSNYFDTDLHGDLSFLGPDGSLLCNQRVKVADDDDSKALELLPGPLYEDVVTLIKKNEEVLGDRLTLRFRFQSDMFSEHNYMTTTIDVAKVSLRIDPKSIELSDEPKNIFRYEDVLLQGAHILREERVELALVNNSWLKPPFLVETSVSFLNSDGTVVGREENEHLFVHSAPWTFSDSLTLASSYNVVVLGLRVIKRSMEGRQDYDVLKYRGVSVIPDERKSPSCFFAEDPKAVLTKEFMSLYQDREFSDFQLKCETDSYPVHRAVLSSRSPFLKTMLSGNITSDCMDIPDLDPSILARFLAFLYTGELGDLQKEFLFSTTKCDHI